MKIDVFYLTRCAGFCLAFAVTSCSKPVEAKQGSAAEVRVKALEDQARKDRLQIAKLETSIALLKVDAAGKGEFGQDVIAHMMMDQSVIRSSAASDLTSIAKYVPASDKDAWTMINCNLSYLNADWTDSMKAYRQAVDDPASKPKQIGMMADQIQVVEKHRNEIRAAGFKLD